MPAAKYRRRSQRNRRREGTAKFVAPAAPDPTAFNVLTVSGAGTAPANGVYTWDNTGSFWAGPSGFVAYNDGMRFVIATAGIILYQQVITGPVPQETGWTLDNGSAPAPTLTYTG